MLSSNVLFEVVDILIYYIMIIMTLLHNYHNYFCMAIKLSHVFIHNLFVQLI